MHYYFLTFTFARPTTTNADPYLHPCYFQTIFLHFNIAKNHITFDSSVTHTLAMTSIRSLSSTVQGLIVTTMMMIMIISQP